MNSRRRFLQQSGLLAAGFMTAPSDIFKKGKKAGIQLYTLRDDIYKDPKAVIGKVAAAGYQEVELFGLSAEEKFFGLTVKEFGELLKANNLTTPSGHYTPTKMLFDNGDGDDVKKLCDVGNALGHSYIIVPYLEEGRRKTIDQYKALAERLNKAGEICKQHNLQLAYHNHDFEFNEIDSQRGYDIFMNSTDASLLKFEMDIYWVVRAGIDPVELMKKQPGRFQLWHVKDMDKADKTLNTEVGNGSIDFKSLMIHAKLSGAKHFLVEQENNYVPDFYGSIQASAKYMKTALLKK